MNTKTTGISETSNSGVADAGHWVRQPIPRFLCAFRVLCGYTFFGLLNDLQVEPLHVEPALPVLNA